MVFIIITESVAMFDQFPKTRPLLPKKIEDLYSTYYKSNREGKTRASFLAKKMESWLHKQIAKDIIDQPGLRKTTLEIGAGTLNQLQYEPEVGVYDIVEPFKVLYEESFFLKRVRNVYSDISEVPENSRYDRITSIASFEHICNLPEVAAKCGLILTDTGILRVAIPNEGAFLWTLGWKLTTGLEFKKKYGLDYGLLMKHEHVNTAEEIEKVLEFFFEDIKCKIFGISKSFSLYRFYTCIKPRGEKCREYTA